jgi:uncharacterized repeat protein (TIGR03803 family)
MAKTIARVFAAGAFALIAAASIAHAAKFSVLHSFCSKANCADGQIAHAGLIADKSGNLYGTTLGGGAHDGGTVFKVTPGGKETVLYSFCQQPNCTDGQDPYTGVVMDSSGNLFGTTACGGNGCGYGVVYELAANGTETVLYAFAGGKDGADPNDLVMDASGNLYGTTNIGGGTGCNGEGCGTVFKISPKGKESVLYRFCAAQNCTDGAFPVAGLILDQSGNLYGTTAQGGSGSGIYGTVFELATDGTETVLYSFCQQNGCADGGSPYSRLAMDASGNLYGTTANGGSSQSGTVFRLAPGGAETVLYSFCQLGSCADGAVPTSGVVLDGAGNLYGTTQSGGSGSDGRNCTGCGTVFKLAPNGVETVLHSFCSKKNCADGGSNLAGLAGLVLKSGTLYGTTPQGGKHADPNTFNAGTVFAVQR